MEIREVYNPPTFDACLSDLERTYCFEEKEDNYNDENKVSHKKRKKKINYLYWF